MSRGPGCALTLFTSVCSKLGHRFFVSAATKVAVSFDVVEVSIA